ncbi:uncharacterized protein STEHIDRAFT_69488, partial [Stereum hirsutum FP-91666 SS1]
GHDSKPSTFNNLGLSFIRRFERLGNIVDIEKAICAQQKAIALTDDGNREKPRMLADLGASFMRRFRRLGNLVDIDEAILIEKQAVALIPDAHKDRHSMLENIGLSFACRFERLEDLSDIREAIHFQQQARAVELTPDSHTDKPSKLGNLGISLSCRFDRLGNIEDIDKAINAQEQAVALTPDGHADKPSWLSSLGGSLTNRFQRLGNLVDIDKAISTHRQAVLLTPYGHADKPGRIMNLGHSLTCRFERLGELVDIDKAIHAHRLAVARTPDDHAGKPSILSALGQSYNCRFLRLGHLVDIDEALSIQRRAASLTPDGHANMPNMLNNIAVSLTGRYKRLGNVVDLDEAISTQKQAVTMIPHGHAYKPAWLNNLAGLFACRFECLGFATDINDATSTYRQSAHLSVGPPQQLFNAALNWSRTFYKAHNEHSLEANASIIELIPRIVWLGTGVSQRYQNISPIGNVVIEAVAAAIELNKPDTALEWIEQGRSIVWGQILRLRSPLNDVKLSSRPELATELEQVSQQLERAGTEEFLTIEAVNSETEVSPEDEAQKHRRLAERYDQLLEEIRCIPGFEHFMKPKQLSYLRDASERGPVAIINVHNTRCDALVVRDPSSHVLHISLLDLSLDDTHKLRQQFVSCLAQAKVRVRENLEDSEGRADRPHDPHGLPRVRMEYILGELWVKVVHPVLDALCFKSSSDSTALPHITWCATGPLAFLPLHAAGHYNRPDGPRAFQYVVSSYTPTIAALVEALKRPEQLNPSILAVSQPNSPGYSDLPGTRQEVQAIESCADGLSLNWLDGASATVDAVLEAMAQSSWCHLACHGVQDPTEPTKSSFVLHNGRLDLHTMMSKSFKSAEIAYLSACQTAKGDEERPEEAIHLAAGMLLAGYRTVFATMWSIGDRDAPIVAREVYSHMLKSSQMGRRRQAAYALHHAVGVLRDKVGEDAFVRWMPFIHFGA